MAFCTPGDVLRLALERSLAASTEKRQAVKVEVPGTQDDSVKFARVGIIAAIGFAIGIAWPRLAGVRLVPSVPVPAAVEASARELTGAPAEVKPPGDPAAALPAPSAAPPEKAPSDRVVVSDVQVASCKNEHGKRAQACDRVDFDRVARERLRELSACPGIEEGAGVLSLGFDLDFEGDKIKNIQSGKSTSLEQDYVDRLLGCARERFSNVSLVGIPHEQREYTLFYRLELLPPVGNKPGKSDGAEPATASSGSAGPDASPASGHATVSWDVALVRSGPARDGEVRARVLSGTRVVVTGKSGDWFRIKYDAKGNQGWVYRTAIGM
jgi:hypothetical protein